VYDGSFEGVLCCVFACFERREMPSGIFTQSELPPTLFPQEVIPTELQKFERVKKGIITKISIEAYELIVDIYFSCYPEKEWLICDFARLGFQMGRKITSCITLDTVDAMLGAAKHLHNESHLLKGFVRFSDYDGVMVAVIEPKNFVLPTLSPHFCDRYAGETFMIYDKTHSAALVHRPGEWRIIPITEFTEPEAGEYEQKIRSLWKLFYDTIAIKERDNPRCRMGHMPKRYWSHMTEMQNENLLRPGMQSLPPR
jgi:probable DNA metabolism protein